MANNTVRSLVEEAVERVVGAHRIRPGIEEALVSAIHENSVIFLSAPPGYGKTTVVYALGLAAAKNSGMLLSAFHVLPMRSIIEDAWARLFEDSSGKPKHERLTVSSVGRQMLGAAESPSMQKPLVFTTVDTFALSLLKLPPEASKTIWTGASLGHGEYARSAIFASATVVDEIQLLLEERETPKEIVLSALGLLASLGCSLIVMSATLPDHMLDLMRDRMPEWRTYRVLRYGRDFRDKDFENAKLSNKIETRVVANGSLEEEALRVVKEKRWKRVAVVVDTVGKTVSVANAIWEKTGLEPLVLHSGLTSEHRRKVLEKARSSGSLILVSTQVIEAGVNLSFQAMVSEASTPTSIVQRAGRLLRDKEGEEGLLTVVYDKSSEKEEHDAYAVYPLRLVRATIKVLVNNSNVAWHLPIVEGMQGYESLLEEAYAVAGEPRTGIDSYLAQKARRLMFSIIASPSKTVGLLEEAGGSLLRDSALVLGIVADQEAVMDTGIDEDKSLPLNKQRIKCLLKKKATTGLYWEGGRLKLRDARRDLEKAASGKMPSPKLEAVLVPPQLYHEKYGVCIKG